MDLSFDVMFFESESDSYKRYEEDIRRLFASVLQINRSAVTLQEKKEEHLYREELSSNIFRFAGSVKIDRKLEKKLLRLITEYCDRLDNSLIAFHCSLSHHFALLRPWLRSVNSRSLYSLAFGTLVKLKQFMPHIRLADKGAKLEMANMNDKWCKSVTAKFEHYRKRLLVEVMTNAHFRFVLDYAAINYIVISKVHGFWSIYLVLATPPLLYEVQKMDVHRKYNSGTHPVPEEGDTTEEENVEEEEKNVRYTKVVRELRKVTIDDSIKPTVFSKSNVLELYPYARRNIDPHKYFKQIWEIVSNVNRYAKTPVYIGKIELSCGSIGDVEMAIPRNLPFDVHYAFQCVANASFQLHDELYKNGSQRTFIETVQDLCRVDTTATKQALVDLFWIQDNNIPVESFYALHSRFTERKRLGDLEQRPDRLVEVRRCIVTPTRTILLPPMLYEQSRLLRMSEPDNALRVYAKDDNLNALNFTVLIPGTREHGEDFLLQNVLMKLQSGIQIKNRNYDYLGGSTSQLRDFGMMFYARDPINGIDASTIREDIGDLSHINCPAKYIARLGQAFSQPIAYLDHIDAQNVTVAPDIRGGMNPLTEKPYVFSDGVGRISRELAVELSALVNSERDASLPFSAFQIRHAGSKGMVSVDPKLPGRQMVLRESMKKFESTLSSIEVVKVSEPRHVHLNRPFINLLEQLGVDSRYIVTLARNHFQRIIDSYSCKCKALEIIKNFSILNRSNLYHAQLRDCAIDIFGETYFRKILDAMIKDSINMVKTKARIKLPEHYGRTMFGVLDETGILKEGQVFAQYSSFENYRERKVVKGKVLVTKFPCMHPGDVRKFTAVDVPELRHICDCLVFPQRGSRPHPDEMAGSDLDGDEYVIIWEKSFIFSRDNHAAMLYPSGTAGKTVTKVEVGDMLQFYIEYIQNNNVGHLANAHLALSDQYESGIYHDECILLAKQHPVALDFAKSGQLDAQQSPRAHYYPDFMEKSETKPTYKSYRALGTVYRLSCMFEETAESDFILDDNLVGNEQLLTFPGWDAFASEAVDAYTSYKNRIRQIQRQFGIEDEMSLLGGVFTQMQKYLIHKQERHDVQEMIKMLLKGARDEFRRQFMTGIGDETLLPEKRKKMAKASAYYLVTRRMNENNKDPCYSLPWIVCADGLCDVANFNSRQRRTHVCSHSLLVRASDELVGGGNPSWVDMPINMWLKINAQTFRGFQYFDENDVFLKTLSHIPTTIEALEHENTDRLDYAIQRVLKSLSSGMETADEFKNMMYLTASITLRRFQKTKDFQHFAEEVNTKKDKEKDTWITCLSMRNVKFRSFVRNKPRQFREKLKKSGVEDVCCHVTENDNAENSLLFVSAFGTIECLKKLRMAITRWEFYDEVVNGSLRIQPRLPTYDE